MEEQSQVQPQENQPISPPQDPVKHRSKLSIIFFALAFLIMAGGLIFLGYQNYQLRLKTNQIQQENHTLKKRLSTPSPTPTIYDEDAPGDIDCSGGTQDNICPRWCTAGSDYDCCTRSNYEWIPGRGCYR